MPRRVLSRLTLVLTALGAPLAHAQPPARPASNAARGLDIPVDYRKLTNGPQVVPSHTLETILWAEADRMRGLAIDSSNLKNQQEVVKNEVKVNVLNQPYGGFPWIDLPMAANTNWYNAHNFYGDFAHLDAATLDDVRTFFKTYYAPNNAVLVVTGDFSPADVKAWIEKYFGNVPSAKLPPPPDLKEPRQEKEKRVGRTDPLANRPALGIGYH